MKKISKITVLVLILIGLIFIGLSNYLYYQNTKQYNSVVVASSRIDNSLNSNTIAFGFNLNPVAQYKEIGRLREKSIEYTNNLLPFINTFSEETRQIKSQANLLGLDTSGFEYQKYDVLEKYDRKHIAFVLDHYLDLDTYNNSLSDAFDNFTKEMKAEGDFVNPLWGKSDLDLEEMIDSMPIEEKVGQMFVFTISGASLTNEQIDRYAEIVPGGIMLMEGNISSATQLKKFSKQLQSTNTNIPLFISVDQEGGVVKRIAWDRTKGQKYWADMDNEKLCKEAESRSKTLLDSWINVNYSPVVDLGYGEGGFINNRVISTDPEVVIQKAQKYIECSQSLGLINTLKHFPGHGATTLDSHNTLPVIYKTKEDWIEADAYTFKNTLDAKQVMISHLVYDKIDKGTPASTSKIFITNILRDEWGYEGLIITDDMNMLHTSTDISVEDAVKNAYTAGNDLIMYIGGPKDFEGIKEALVEQIKDESLDEEHLNEALGRILRVKRGFGGIKRDLSS